MDRALADPYDPQTHPSGIVNLGTAENKVQPRPCRRRRLHARALLNQGLCGWVEHQLMAPELVAKAGHTLPHPRCLSCAKER
jgi:hypothetical protein